MEKTNVIIFSTKQGTFNKPNEIHLLTDRSQLLTKNTTFLGVQIDEF